MTTPDTFAAGIEAAAKWHEEQAECFESVRDNMLYPLSNRAEAEKCALVYRNAATHIRNLKREHRGCG